jgi:hypothetical protein
MRNFAIMTRTMLFGIFVLAGRPLSAPQLIALARPLGISAANVKSHLTRMVADASLRRSGPVRKALYSPSRRREGMIAAIQSRLDTAPPPRWDGSWLMLSPRLSALRRSDREDVIARLWFDGFRPCGGTTFIRPAWPEAWAMERARKFPGVCVRGTLVGTIDAAALYELDALDARAARLAAWIARQKIPRRPDATAFALRLRVGGSVAAMMGHDPRVPPAIWGRRRGMRALARAFQRFERRIAPLAELSIRSI